MFTTIRDENDRLLKSATVTINFLPFRSLIFSFFRCVRRVQVLRVISRPSKYTLSSVEPVTQWPRAWTSRVKFIEIISVYGYIDTYRSPWMTFTKLPFENIACIFGEKPKRILQSRVQGRNFIAFIVLELPETATNHVSSFLKKSYFFRKLLQTLNPRN